VQLPGQGRPLQTLGRAGLLLMGDRLQRRTPSCSPDAAGAAAAKLLADLVCAAAANLLGVQGRPAPSRRQKTAAPKQGQKQKAKGRSKKLEARARPQPRCPLSRFAARRRNPVMPPSPDPSLVVVVRRCPRSGYWS